MPEGVRIPGLTLLGTQKPESQTAGSYRNDLTVKSIFLKRSQSHCLNKLSGVLNSITIITIICFKIPSKPARKIMDCFCFSLAVRTPLKGLTCGGDTFLSAELQSVTPGQWGTASERLTRPWDKQGTCILEEGACVCVHIYGNQLRPGVPWRDTGGANEVLLIALGPHCPWPALGKLQAGMGKNPAVSAFVDAATSLPALSPHTGSTSISFQCPFELLSCCGVHTVPQQPCTVPPELYSQHRQMQTQREEISIRVL